MKQFEEEITMKKKLIALLCAAALLLTTAAIAAQAEPKPATDTRLADTSDALDILKCIVGLTDPLPLDPYDFNENGVIDNGDALEVLKSIVKIRDEIMIAFESEHTDPPSTTTPETTTSPPSTTEPPTTTKLETIKIGNSVWQEVPMFKDEGYTRISYAPFDLRAIITGQDYRVKDFYFNTCVFSGTIVSMKEYTRSWTDADGVPRGTGQFRNSIIEVEVSKVYHGVVAEKGDTVRMLYNMSVSEFILNSVRLKIGREYVFASCIVLDEKYTNYTEKYDRPNTNDGSVEFADVLMGGVCRSVFPIVDENVFLNVGFLAHDEEARKKVFSPETIEEDIFTTERSVATAMRRDDFDEAFIRLFVNPEKLPTARSYLTDR